MRVFGNVSALPLGYVFRFLLCEWSIGVADVDRRFTQAKSALFGTKRACFDFLAALKETHGVDFLFVFLNLCIFQNETQK